MSLDPLVLWYAVWMTWVEWMLIKAYRTHRMYKTSQEGLDKPE